MTVDLYYTIERSVTPLLPSDVIIALVTAFGSGKFVWLEAKPGCIHLRYKAEEDAIAGRMLVGQLVRAATENEKGPE